MSGVWKRLDEVLARVPADSSTGRRVHDELVVHLDEAVARRVGEGQDYEQAISAALDDFGPAEQLEPDYYRDYVAQRYAFGLFDREAFVSGALWRRLGALLVVAGVVFYQVLPTVASFVAALTCAWAGSEAGGSATDVRGGTEHAATNPLPWLLDPQYYGFRPWAVLMGLGVLLFAIGGLRSLRRLHLPVPRSHLVLLLAVAGAGFGAIAVAFDPSRYVEAFVASIFEPRPGDVPPPGATGYAWAGSAVLVAMAAWVFWLAARAGVADTFLLKRGAVQVACMAVALPLMAHGTLHDLLAAIWRDPQHVSPAWMIGQMRLDLTAFVLGSGLLAIGVIGLDGTFAAADRVWFARRQ